MFKTELHCHSNDASPCSTESVESLTKIYSQAGYDTMILTNHFSKPVYDHYGMKSIGEYVDFFMSAVKKMQDAAQGKFTVLVGAEIRFNDSCNDYLCFGMTEEFMRLNEGIFDLSPFEFHEICKQNGWLFIQAHPFRNGMTVVNPAYLDGVEVYNGHIGHASRNFIAESWANEYGLIKTSGTDLHYEYVPATGGILTEEKITSISQLISVLKNGNYQLLKTDLVK
ncbi:MAG: hypothetical protein IJY84_00180 [Clostridia bacterium]|nr:hypothetical protein [Clostridia bacterium]